MRIVTLNEETKKDILSNLLKRSPDNYGSYEATVKEIVEDVHINRDAALFKYTEKFDKAKIRNLISNHEQQAHKLLKTVNI